MVNLPGEERGSFPSFYARVHAKAAGTSSPTRLQGGRGAYRNLSTKLMGAVSAGREGVAGRRV